MPVTDKDVIEQDGCTIRLPSKVEGQTHWQIGVLCADEPPKVRLYMTHPCWAVISHNKVEGTNLTYTEAFDLAAEVRKETGVSCTVVTKEVAERMSNTLPRRISYWRT